MTSHPDVATTLLVEPGAHAAPGGAATLRVHARNVTAAVRDLRCTVVGLDGAWLPAPVAVPAVPPDATVTVDLPLLPPVGAAPGEYPFVVVVESRAAGVTPATGSRSDEVARTVADATLRVDGASGLVLTVEPAETRAVRSRRVQVVLANRGDRPTRVRLAAGVDPAGFVDLGAGEVDVAPHASVRVPARAGARRPAVVGAPRRIGWHVTATGERAPQRFDAVLTARPVVTGPALRVAAVVAVAALWVGLVLAALPWVSRQVAAGSDDRPTPTPTAGVVDPDRGAGPAAPGGPGGPGAPGDPGAPGGGSGDGGAGGGAPVADDEGVRIGGVVTARDPSGVTVQVVPATAVRPGGPEGPAAEAAERPEATGPRAAEVALAAGRAGAAAALVAALRDRREEAPVGKVSGLALPVERTDTPGERRSTRTDDEGAWAFAGLSASARYLLTFAKAGYETRRFWVTGAEAAAAPFELDLAPGDGTLSGTVRGPDGPAGGVEVVLSDGTTTVTTRTATTGDVGRWQVEGLSTPSTYLVSASSPRLGAQGVLVRLDAAGSRGVDLTLRAGVATLVGAVSGRDALGGHGGLGGVRVTVRAGDVVRTATTVTGDARGTFVLPDLPVPADYTLTAEASGYATQTQRLRLGTAGRGPVSVTLASLGGTVNGTARDERGRAVAAAGLTLTGPTGTFKTMSASDARGTFRFDGIPAGQYSLHAEVFGHEPASAQVEVTGSGSRTVDLVLRRLEGAGLVSTSQIRGRVTDAATGGRITCPHLRADEETCELTVTATFVEPDGTERTERAVAEPDEPYELPATGRRGLFPGRYTLELTAPGYEPGRVQVTVPMGQVVEAATVALQPSPSVVGTVAARVGVVPRTACVVAVDTGDPAPGPDACALDAHDRCTTDARGCAFVGDNGSYAVNRLRAGTYDVHVVLPADSDYVRPAPVTVTLAPGDVRRVDVLLDRLGRLVVWVYEPDGTGGLRRVADPVVTLDPEPDTLATQRTDEGSVELHGIPTGEYAVTARTAGGASGTRAGLAISLNQEAQVEVVVTSRIAPVSGRVVTLLGGEPEGVAGATVTVSGVVGYVGLTPVPDTDTATTYDDRVPGDADGDRTGAFEVCTTGGVNGQACPTDAHVADVPLVEPRMDVAITRTGFADLRARGVSTENLAPFVLTPLGKPFRGTVRVEPAPAPAVYGQVVFRVVAAPPGTGDIAITSDTSGALTWTDSAQPAANLIRPGRYTVTATLPGYLSSPVDLTVTVADPTPPELVLSLQQNGFLRVELVDGAGAPVRSDAVAVLTRAGADDARPTLPGEPYVDFGELPPGSYPLTVRAAGFSTHRTTVTVTPGRTTADPVRVELQRLYTLTGRVTATVTDGVTRAVSGARVTATLGDLSLSATTGPDGTYRITGTTEVEGVGAGTWQVTATAPAHTATADSTRTLRLDPPPTGASAEDTQVAVGDLVLTPQRASLSVTVTSAATPQPGLTVELTATVGGSTVRVTGQDPGSTGTYTFGDLLPVAYILNVSGRGFSPVAMTVELAAGETRALVVQVTAPTGSVQGLVQRQAVNGVTTPVGDAEVRLTPAGGTAISTRTDASGRYRFASVTAGEYVVAVSQGGLEASRTVALQPGGELVVDLVLVERSYALAVLVRSSSDLAGALVSLSGPYAVAAQPLAPTTGGFSTTFAQLAAGPWTVAVTGPAGHLGTRTAPAVTLTADRTVTIDVAETEVRLRASGPAAGPRTVTVRVVPAGGGARDLVVTVGGETVVWVPRAGATVSAVDAGGWDLGVAPAQVPASATVQVVELTVTARSTAVEVLDAPSTVVEGTTLSVGVRVRAGTTAATGSVVLERSTGGTWTQVGQATLATNGTATVTASTAGWTGGAATLRVRYPGSGPFAASQATVTGVTVEIPTTTTLAATATTLTATVRRSTTGGGTPTGAVQFQAQSGGTWTTITGCGAVALSGGTAACTPGTALAGGTPVRARFTATGVWADSGPATATVPGGG